MSKSGIVNVRMVITEEKILSNIDKVQKLINPKSKKQIIQLEDESGQNFYKAVEYTSELAQKINVSLGTKNQLKETDIDYIKMNSKL